MPHHACHLRSWPPAPRLEFDSSIESRCHAAPHDLQESMPKRMMKRSPWRLWSPANQEQSAAKGGEEQSSGSKASRRNAETCKFDFEQGGCGARRQRRPSKGANLTRHGPKHCLAKVSSVIRLKGKVLVVVGTTHKACLDSTQWNRTALSSASSMKGRQRRDCQTLSPSKRRQQSEDSLAVPTKCANDNCAVWMMPVTAIRSACREGPKPTKLMSDVPHTSRIHRDIFVLGARDRPSTPLLKDLYTSFTKVVSYNWSLCCLCCFRTCHSLGPAHPWEHHA